MQLLLHGVSYKLFDAATAATGASTPIALPAVAGSLVWQTYFGTNPSVLQLDLEFSLDGVHWDAVDSSTVVTGEVRTFATVGGSLVRANVVAITGGVGVTVAIIAQRI